VCDQCCSRRLQRDDDTTCQSRRLCRTEGSLY